MTQVPKLKLHSKPIQSVQVNRPLIITVVIIIVTVLLLAIVSAFNKTERKPAKHDLVETAKAATAADRAIVVSPELKELPENYSDVNAIKKYSHSSASDETFILAQQLKDLQNSYLLLQKQLANKSEPVLEQLEQREKFESPDLKQAKTSGLVFAGLSSGIDNALDPTADRFRLPGQGTSNQSNVSPTDEQAELFKKQAQDKQKLAVIKASDNPDEIYDMHNMFTPVSPYQVLAGTMIPASLITGIDTSIAGLVIAQVRSNIYDTVSGKYLLIPRGSKLIGEYDSRVTSGQRRILLTFNRVIRPDGSSILLGKSFSSDMVGLAGIEGNVNNHWGRILGAATISTIFSVGAGAASDRIGGNNNYPSARQNAVMGGARGITNVGDDLARRAIDIAPTITVAPGEHLNVTVRKDIVLPPFGRK